MAIADKNEEYEKGDIRKNKKIKENNEHNYKSSNASPLGIKRKIKKESKTARDKNFICIFKGSSDSDEEKKSLDNNKPKNQEKAKKHKKEQDKMSPKKERYYSTKLIKKKNRKFTVNELNRNNMNIRSPKKTSPGRTFRNSGKKNNDKNKKWEMM